MKNLLIAIILAASCNLVIAHSGGTDSKGCHYDHQTGGYHCH